MFKQSFFLVALFSFSLILSTFQAGLPQFQSTNSNIQKKAKHESPFQSKQTTTFLRPNYLTDIFWPHAMRANKRDGSIAQSPATNLEVRGIHPYKKKPKVSEHPSSKSNKKPKVPKHPSSKSNKKPKPPKESSSSKKENNEENSDLFWPKGMNANKRDASTVMSGGNVFEGVNHTAITAPGNSSYNILRIGQNNEQLGVFWTAKPKQNKATQAFIMIHGKLRDGGNYWTIMNNIVQNAIQNNVSGVDPDAIIVAPQFFSARDNSGQYDNSTLAWGDVNAWQAGEKAIHPAGTSISSFDALDALANKFLDVTQYPRLQKLTIIGHGGGGQLIQRYATVGNVDSNDRVHVRFIHGDPSSCNYFTTDRPTISNQTLPAKADCPTYNYWRYGFDNFTASSGTTKKPQEYFQQYISRDVVSIVGYQDTDASGDNYCMAVMQGGSARRDRNLIWWRYINTLAKTGEDLDGFPGSFDNLPDWSNLVKNNIFGVRLLVVEDADHDAELVFESTEGRAALFDVKSSSFPTGWRPDGWKNTSRAIAPAYLATKKEPNQPVAKYSSATALRVTLSVFLVSLFISFTSVL